MQKKFLADVSDHAGVYLMYDAKEQVIYVGKAKNLKKRLASYFRTNMASKKTIALVASIRHVLKLLLLHQKRALLSRT